MVIWEMLEIAFCVVIFGVVVKVIVKLVSG